MYRLPVIFSSTFKKDKKAFSKFHKHAQKQKSISYSLREGVYHRLKAYSYQFFSMKAILYINF